MSNTHSEIITQIALNVGSLTSAAEDKITNDILAQAASKTESMLGSTDYDEYVTLFGTGYNRDSEYHLLTDNEKKLRDWETAEAYYVLYYLALALREMQEDYTSMEKSTYGEGELQPSTIAEIITQQDAYKRQADSLISKHNSGGIYFNMV